MENNKMQTETMRLAYETPSVELIMWASDAIIRTSPEIGGEYPDGWN